MSELINCLTFIINNWDELENDNVLIYRDNERNLNIPIRPYLGLCSVFNFFETDQYELQNAIREWSNLYSMNYEPHRTYADYWIAGYYEYLSSNKFKNTLRLHAVIWFRNKLLSEMK